MKLFHHCLLLDSVDAVKIGVQVKELPSETILELTLGARRILGPASEVYGA